MTSIKIIDQKDKVKMREEWTPKEQQMRRKEYTLQNVK